MQQFPQQQPIYVQQPFQQQPMYVQQPFPQQQPFPHQQPHQSRNARVQAAINRNMAQQQQPFQQQPMYAQQPFPQQQPVYVQQFPQQQPVYGNPNMMPVQPFQQSLVIPQDPRVFQQPFQPPPQVIQPPHQVIQQSEEQQQKHVAVKSGTMNFLTSLKVSPNDPNYHDFLGIPEETLLHLWLLIDVINPNEDRETIPEEVRLCNILRPMLAEAWISKTIDWGVTITGITDRLTCSKQAKENNKMVNGFWHKLYGVHDITIDKFIDPVFWIKIAKDTNITLYKAVREKYEMLGYPFPESQASKVVSTVLTPDAIIPNPKKETTLSWMQEQEDDEVEVVDQTDPQSPPSPDEIALVISEALGDDDEVSKVAYITQLTSAIADTQVPSGLMIENLGGLLATGVTTRPVNNVGESYVHTGGYDIENQVITKLGERIKAALDNPMETLPSNRVIGDLQLPRDKESLGYIYVAYEAITSGSGARHVIEACNRFINRDNQKPLQPSEIKTFLTEVKTAINDVIGLKAFNIELCYNFNLIMKAFGYEYVMYDFYTQINAWLLMLVDPIHDAAKRKRLMVATGNAIIATIRAINEINGGQQNGKKGLTFRPPYLYHCDPSLKLSELACHKEAPHRWHKSISLDINHEAAKPWKDILECELFNTPGRYVVAGSDGIVVILRYHYEGKQYITITSMV